MCDVDVTAGHDEDTESIETHARVLRASLEKICADHRAKLAYLAGIDRFYRRAHHEAAPRFDLDEHERVAVERDDVDFAVARAEVPLEDLVARAREDVCGDVLDEVAKFFGGEGVGTASVDFCRDRHASHDAETTHRCQSSNDQLWMGAPCEARTTDYGMARDRTRASRALQR